MPGGRRCVNDKGAGAVVGPVLLPDCCRQVIHPLMLTDQPGAAAPPVRGREGDK